MEEEKDSNLSFIIDLDIEKLKQQAAEANDTINKIGKDTRGATDNVNTFVNNTQNVIHEINERAEQASGNIEEIGIQAQQTNNILSKIGKYVAGYFALGTIKGFAQQIFSVRAEMQGLETSFQVLLGDKEAATQLFSEIKDFAVNTPMELPTLSKGAQTLLSFGIANEKVMPVLKQIGDLSMGNADKFNSLILAYSQMTSTGKLMGQDLMQMINAGFNPLNEIAKNTGKSIGELKEEMSKGKLTLEEVQKAFETATSAGGQFDGMVEKQSKTLGGALSNYNGAIQDMQNELGERFEGVFAEAIDIATILVKNYKILANAIEVVAAAYGTYKAATLAVIAIERVERIVELYKAYGSLSKMIKASTAAQAAFNLVAKANPLFLVASALAGATVAFMKYKKSVDDAREKEESYNGQMESAKNTLEERIKLIKQYTTEVRQSEKVTQKQIESFRKLISLDPKLKELFGSVEQLREMTDVQLDANIQEYADSNTLDAQRKILKNAQNKIIEYRNEIAKLEDDEKNGYGSIGNDALIVEYEEKIKKLSKVVVEASKSISQYWEDVDSAFKSNDESDTRTAELDYIKQVNKDLVDGNLTLNERKKIYKDLLVYEQNTPDYIRSEDTIHAVRTFEKEIKREEEERKARLRTAKKADEDFKEEQKRFEKEHELEVRQAKLDLQEESLQKEIDQINLNKDRTLEAIRNAEKAKLEEYKRSKYNEYIVKSNGTSKMTYDQWEEKNGAKVQLPSGVKAIYREQETNAENKAINETKKAYKSALEEYLTFQEQMLKIAEKYEKQRADLGGKLTPENRARMEKQEREEMESLATSFAEEKEEYQRFLIDIGFMTLKQSEEELKKLSGELSKAKVNITDKNQADNVEMLTAKVARLREQVKQLKLEEYEASKSNAELFGRKVNTKAWDAVGNSVGELSSAFGDLAKNSDGALKEVSEGAEIFLSSTSAIIEGITRLSRISSEEIVGVSKAAASAIKSVEYASVVLTIVSAALSLIQMIKGEGDKFSRNMETYKQEIFDFKRAIENLKIAAMIDNDNTNSIFSNNLWNQSVKNMKASKLALDDYQSSLEAFKKTAFSTYFNELNNTKQGYDPLRASVQKYLYETYKDDLRSFGADGRQSIYRMYDAMKEDTKTLGDTFKLLLDNAGNRLAESVPELFENADKLTGLNMDYLNEMVNNTSIMDNYTQQVQNDLRLINDSWQNYQKTIEETKNYLQNIFGNLGDDIMDALVESFEAGTDAAKSFSESAIDSVSNMLETFEKQMIYRNVFQDYFNKASEDMQRIAQTDYSESARNVLWRLSDKTMSALTTDWGELEKLNQSALKSYGKSLNELMSDENEGIKRVADLIKMEEYTSVMKGLTDQVIAGQEEANRLLGIAQDLGDKYGFELFKSQENDVTAGKSQGLASASQDSIDELNGRITAIQGHTYNIWQNSDILVDVTNDILVQVSQINHNTQRLNSIENTLNNMATRGIKVLS